MTYSIKEMKAMKKDGFTNIEIAAELGCSEELVKKKLARKKSVVKNAKTSLNFLESRDNSPVMETKPKAKSETKPEAKSETDPNEPEVKRNWLGFKKKDQS